MGKAWRPAFRSQLLRNDIAIAHPKAEVQKSLREPEDETAQIDWLRLSIRDGPHKTTHFLGQLFEGQYGGRTVLPTGRLARLEHLPKTVIAYMPLSCAWTKAVRNERKSKNPILTHTEINDDVIPEAP